MNTLERALGNVFGPWVSYSYLVQGKKYLSRFQMNYGTFYQRRNFYSQGGVIYVLVNPKHPMHTIVLDEYYRWYE